jgi:hypothetical protein
MPSRDSRGARARPLRWLTGPMSEQQWAVVTLVGVLSFGLSGVVDWVLGLGFSVVKAGFLLVGLLYSALLLRRWARSRRQKDRSQ